PEYRWKGGKLNSGWVTTFNQYAVVSENRLTIIPPDFDLKIAPLFGCAVTTAVGVINNDAKVKIGQSVVIFGVGGVGMNIAQAAAMVSAQPIVAIDLFDHKLTTAERFGASHVINSKDMTPAEVDAEVKKIAGAVGADVVIDTTGNSRIIEQAYQLTHPDGRTILVGVPTKGDNISIYSLPLHFNKVLTGSHGGDSQPHLDIPRYIRLMEAGKMTLDGLITHQFPLEEINQALDLLKSGQSGRILVDMD
ncbi:MAG: zinc-binding dehydrogenase, partial [Deltaproteobacteria bacterium]|nr:zinc-binding dehydrogenase [Deltaproteobacteria bacterium]